MNCNKAKKLILRGDSKTALEHFTNCEECASFESSLAGLDEILATDAVIPEDGYDSDRIWFKVRDNRPAWDWRYSPLRWLAAPVATIVAASVFAFLIPIHGIANRESDFAKATVQADAPASFIAGHMIVHSTRTLITQPFIVTNAGAAVRQVDNQRPHGH